MLLGTNLTIPEWFYSNLEDIEKCLKGIETLWSVWTAWSVFEIDNETAIDIKILPGKFFSGIPVVTFLPLAVNGSFLLFHGNITFDIQIFFKF